MTWSTAAHEAWEERELDAYLEGFEEGAAPMYWPDLQYAPNGHYYGTPVLIGPRDVLRPKAELVGKAGPFYGPFVVEEEDVELRVIQGEAQPLKRKAA